MRFIVCWENNHAWGERGKSTATNDAVLIPWSRRMCQAKCVTFSSFERIMCGICLSSCVDDDVPCLALSCMRRTCMWCKWIFCVAFTRRTDTWECERRNAWCWAFWSNRMTRQRRWSPKTERECESARYVQISFKLDFVCCLAAAAVINSTCAAE